MTRLVHALETHPVHLGRGGAASVQPEFTGGMAWYADYVARTGGDGFEGRLVSLFHFTGNWDAWEMHPHGDELVVCTAGEITLIQEHDDGALHSETLRAGECLINPAGVWHTANVPAAASALFVTAGIGTQHRARG
ncbi:cupin domain-containing protein [Novosphingobium sp. 1949]|uniref:Cupin domain-containing protein n=1 Tax=Novosphingobium organovorum TaxID=2930092 RepID=A0ABT0BGE1_9SPHN|nr:cupin domain-containing protein [Novosphingobium organovorum]MCJ2184137.1 cupin domain-containing protein [Novosphingobium organovorum]